MARSPTVPTPREVPPLSTTPIWRPSDPSFQPEQVGAESLAGLAEPARQCGQQARLIVADPGYVAVRSQQYGRHIEFLADVHHMVHPVRPAGHVEFAGLVEQQSPATVE